MKRFFLLVWILAFIAIIVWKNLDEWGKRQKLSQIFSQEETAVDIGHPTQSANCQVSGPFPDKNCTPGAVFDNAGVEKICVPGYTRTVRSVPVELRKQIYEAYRIPYPQPHGSFELDHLIPLALAGNNEAANLWPEAAAPSPGFKEKDIVEIYLQGEVCAGRLSLRTAQEKIADDWTAIYNNLSSEEIRKIKAKYKNWSN